LRGPIWATPQKRKVPPFGGTFLQSLACTRLVPFLLAGGLLTGIGVLALTARILLLLAGLIAATTLLLAGLLARLLVLLARIRVWLVMGISLVGP
jgi:hypothetical protein